MKTSQVLRKAAKLIDHGHTKYSCIAICKAFGISGLDRMPAHLFYVDLFAPEEWMLWDRFESEDNPRDLRILALCLAAAVAESEGD